MNGDLQTRYSILLVTAVVYGILFVIAAWRMGMAGGATVILGGLCALAFWGVQKLGRELRRMRE